MTRLDASSRLALGVSFLLLAGLAAALPRRGLSSTDEGNKLIQVENLERTGRLAIAYPARALDPSLDFFPDGGNHFIRTRDGVFSFHPFYFPLLAWLPHAVFGDVGLRVWPILGTILLLWALAALLEQLGFRGNGPWLLGFLFCTPLVVYALGFWEHSLALSLVTGALWLVVASAGRARSASLLFAAGLLVGLSTLLREEGYVLLLALVGGYLWAYRRGWRAAALVGGWLAIMTPAWLLHRHLFGHFLGLHALAYDPGALHWPRGLDASAVASTARKLYIGLLEFHPDPGRRLALAIPFLLCFAAGLALRKEAGRWIRLTLLSGVVVAAIVAAWWLVVDPAPQQLLLYTQGLLPSVPLLALALLFGRYFLSSAEPALRFAVVVAALFVGGCGVNLRLDYFGMLWGPRVMFAVFPLLLVLVRSGWESLCAAGPGTARVARSLLAALVVLSLTLQGFGLYVVRATARAQAALVQEIERRPASVVVTDVFWVPEALAPIFFDRQILYVRSDAELHELWTRLAARGAGDFVFVAARHSRQLSATGAAELVAAATGRTRLLEPGAEYSELMLLDGRAP